MTNSLAIIKNMTGKLNAARHEVPLAKSFFDANHPAMFEDINFNDVKKRNAFDCSSESELEDDDAMKSRYFAQSECSEHAFSFPPEDELNEPDVWEVRPRIDFHDHGGRNHYFRSLDVALTNICVGYFLSADHVFRVRMCCSMFQDVLASSFFSTWLLWRRHRPFQCQDAMLRRVRVPQAMIRAG